MRFPLKGLLAAVVLGTTGTAVGRPALSQTPVSRRDAVAAAVTTGARLALARADTAVAFGQLVTARMLQNPTLAGSYSKSTPNYHVTLEIPIDLPPLRGARIGAARAARRSAQYSFAFERAASVLDADTIYTRALAARERGRLSLRNAQAADSLRRITITRRAAGDASDLDVELATVSAGQAANLAAADSLMFMSALLDLQAVMGLAADRVTISLADSLALPPPFAAADSTVRAGSAPLTIAAAEAALEAARLAARVQHRSLFATPGIVAGIETGDPTGAEPGILPTVGLALPLPLFNRNRGPIIQADAEQARAAAALALVRAQSQAEIARTRRELTVALEKVARDRVLVASAERVAAMSLTAYREGAASLANVLEAQRSARDVLAQFVDDVAAAWIAAAELRVLTLSAGPTS